MAPGGIAFFLMVMAVLVIVVLFPLLIIGWAVGKITGNTAGKITKTQIGASTAPQRNDDHG